MIRRFGIKEAEQTSLFAKSIEQKQTVFAMLGLMGVPIVVKEQVAKLTKKLSNKISKRQDKVDVLAQKKADLQCSLASLEMDKKSAECTAAKWDISDIR